MFKKIILTSLLGASSLLLAKVNVMVSIIPQQTFVEKIGGDKVNVTTMVRPGSDPHTYAPKPSQMVALSKAEVYFPIKVEFEKAWLDKFIYHNKSMKIADMTKGITFIELDKPKYAYSNTQKTETLPYEWLGLFELKKGTYTWSFAKVSGRYADPKMKFLMLKAEGNSTQDIKDYKNKAKTFFNHQNSLSVKDGNSLNAKERFYTLHFDETKEQTLFTLVIQKSGQYLFFTEHMPFEFEDKEHFLKDLVRNDIEPTLQEPKSGAHHHHHGGLDPHTWTVPSNVKIMAKNIYETLVTLDAENEVYYQENYKRFLEEIEQTDREIREILLSVPKGSQFMVFHPSWGYFAKAFGLVQLSVEVDGKEPKPRILKQIIDEARKQNIKAIFTQKEFSDKSAKVIARELNVKVIKETPLASNWSENLIKKAHAIANNQ